VDSEEVRKVMNEVLNERDRIDQQTHRDDHIFLAQLREQRRKREEMWEKTKKTALGFIVIALLTKIGALAYYVGDLVVEGWKHRGG